MSRPRLPCRARALSMRRSTRLASSPVRRSPRRAAPKECVAFSAFLSNSIQPCDRPAIFSRIDVRLANFHQPADLHSARSAARRVEHALQRAEAAVAGHDGLAAARMAEEAQAAIVDLDALAPDVAGRRPELWSRLGRLLEVVREGRIAPQLTSDRDQGGCRRQSLHILRRPDPLRGSVDRAHRRDGRHVRTHTVRSR